MKSIMINLLLFSILLNTNISSLSQNYNNKITTVNIGFASSLFPEIEFRDAKAAIESWSEELIKDGYLDYILSASILKSNDDIKNAFQQNKISIVALHALDYLYIKNDAKILPLLIPSSKNDVTENYIVLVNKKSNIKNISQLKNKKIAIQMGNPNVVPYIWLENLIMMNESYLINNYCTLLDLKKDSRAIFSVFFNQNDACVVNSKVYYTMCKLNRQLLDNLVIINTSPNFVRDIFCISGNLEKKYIGNLLDATISIQNYDSGKKILNLFQFERFIIYEEKYIKSLEQLLSDNQKYQKKLKLKK
jgi:ABC-type phosphate/phosphonate transport system substrate-binding protein